jgi:DNA-binding CsgD family transcriptional regulator
MKLNGHAQMSRTIPSKTSSVKKQLGKAFWVPDKLALLGTKSDGALAKQWGINHFLVFTKRKSLGIPSYRKFGPKDWTPAELAMLGNKSDYEISKKLKLHKTSVVNKRNSLGIAAFVDPSKVQHDWKDAELALLGKFTDRCVAERIGLPMHAVMAKRQRLGIPSCRKFSPPKKARKNAIPWTKKNLALLGKLPDVQVAEIIGTNRKSVIAMRLKLGITSYAVNTQFWHSWTEEEIQQLGTATDRELAEKWGIGIMCVIDKRRQLGINAYYTSKGLRMPHQWKDDEIKLLGTDTDPKIAEKLGIGVGIVWKKRQELKIPAHLGKRNISHLWTPEILARLGKESYRSIAKDLNISHESVRNKCIQLGILIKRSGKTISSIRA